MGTIPRPAGPPSRRVKSVEGVCLAGQMQLVSSKADIALYYDILDTVGTLCDRYHPYTKSIPKGEDAKKAIVEEAIRAQPRLATYVDAWPVSVMIQMHRQLRKGGSRTGIIGFDASPAPQSVKNRKFSSRLARLAAARKARSEECARSVTYSESLIPQQNDAGPQRRATEDKANTFVANSRNPNIVASWASTKPVRLFLRSLPQDLSFMLPIFVGYGIKDEPSLRAMILTRDWRRWLYGWVNSGQLTELQYKMVSDGLEKFA